MLMYVLYYSLVGKESNEADFSVILDFTEFSYFLCSSASF